MKKRMILFCVMALSIAAFAQQSATKGNIKVYGNCGMCKKTIETAAIEGGANAAVWNQDTRILKVKFQSNNTSLDSIQKVIVSKGYDTQSYRSSDENYNSLHKCCKYERKP
jgi:mercuric ion binding protein